MMHPAQASSVGQYAYPNDNKAAYFHPHHHPAVDGYGSVGGSAQPLAAATHHAQQAQQAQQAQHHQNLEHQLLVAHQLAKLAHHPSNAWAPQPAAQSVHPAQQVQPVSQPVPQDKYWPTVSFHAPCSSKGWPTTNANLCIDPAILRINGQTLPEVRAATPSAPTTTTRMQQRNVQTQVAQLASSRTADPMPGQEGWTWEGRTSWLAPVLAPLFLQLSEAFQEVVGTRPIEAVGFGEGDLLSLASQAVVHMAPAAQPSSYAVANDRTYEGRVYESLQADSFVGCGYGADGGANGAAGATTWIGSTPRSAVEPTSLTTTHLTMETFTNFVQTVLQQPIITPTTVFLALFYALRLYRLLSDTGASDESNGPEGEQEANDHPEESEASQALMIQRWKQDFKRAFLTPSTSLPFKLFVLGLMMANKHLDDNTFLNKTWTEVTGIPLTELNTMERFYLRLTHFDLVPPQDEWVTYLHDLEYFVSRRLIESYDQHTGGTETIDRALAMNEVGPDQYRWVLAALEEEFPRDHALRSNPTQRSSSVVSYLPPGNSTTMDTMETLDDDHVSMYDSPALAPLSPQSGRSTVDSLNASPYRGFVDAASPTQRYEDQFSPSSSSSSSSSSSPSLESQHVVLPTGADRVHVVGSGSVPHLAPHLVQGYQPMDWTKRMEHAYAPSQQLASHAQAQAQAQARAQAQVQVQAQAAQQAQMDWYNYHYGSAAYAQAHQAHQAQQVQHAHQAHQAQRAAVAAGYGPPGPYHHTNGMVYPSYGGYGYDSHQSMHHHTPSHHLPIAGL